MRFLLAAIVAPLLLAGCARTAALDGPYDDGFTTYDTDRDGSLTRDEFGAGFGATPYYRDYDLDRDGFLDEDEFGATGFGYDYGTFDTDRDGLLDDDEFYGGVYDAYDTDRDGRLTEDEFGVGFGSTFGVRR